MPHLNGRPPSMAPTPREREWRRILDRWRKSGATCRAFCRREALDENSFYHWKREVRLRDERRRAARPSPRRSRPLKPKPLLHGPTKMLRETTEDLRTEAVAVPERPVRSAPTGPLHGFRPVRVTGAFPSPFEIALSDGRLLRVPPDFDAAALTRLLPILEAPTPNRGGSSC